MKKNQNILQILSMWMVLFVTGPIASGADTTSDTDYGRYLSTPVVLQADSNYFIATHTADATQWGYPSTNDTYEMYGREIYYSVTLPERMSLIIHTYGSELLCTNVQIYGPGYSTIRRAKDKNSYIDYYRNYLEPDDESCELSQDCYVAFDCPPGTYDIRTRGCCYYHGNSVNGPIRVTVIGFGENSKAYPGIPEDFIPGNEGHPFQLGNFYSDFSVSVDTAYSEHYFRARQLVPPAEIYYEFTLHKEMTLTVDSRRFGGEMAVIGDSLSFSVPRNTNLWYRHCKPGRYVVIATCDSCPEVDFMISGTVPKPQPPEGEYLPFSIQDKSVIGKNYVSTRTMLDESGTEFAEEIAHVDGLGRPRLTVMADASPDGGDIATYQDYDSVGRISRTWLPAVSTVPGINRYAVPESIDYSVYGGDSHPYSMPVYEKSPFGRVVRQFGPGDGWAAADKAIETDRLLNTAGGVLSCICFDVTDTPDKPSAPVTVSCSASDTGSVYFNPGELTVVRTTDEDGNTAYEFKDAFGRTVLNRRILDGAFVDTYYIYDHYGNLTVVLPPEASSRISGACSMTDGQSEILDDYAYVYTYDRRGRLTSKRLPGTAPTEYVYDSTDRCILWRDGNMRALGRWHFDIADVFGRPCLSGTCAALHQEDAFNASVRAVRAESTQSGASTLLMGYAVDGVRISGAQVLTATYYDDYSFLGSYGSPSADTLGFETSPGYGERFGNVRGRVTGTAVALPVDAGADSLTYLWSALYYDSRDRVVQTVTTNHLGGIDCTLTAYDFAGRPVKTETVHTSSLLGDTTAVIQQWERSYDRWSRPLTVRHRAGRAGEWTLLSARAYDAVGRMSSDTRGGNAGIAATYAYDIRSRLLAVESRLYRQTLDYTPGGNISRMTWWSFSPNGSNRTYTYSYDGLSRLTAADYSDDRGGTGRYSTTYSYDLNGNVTSLTRMGLYDNSPRHPMYGLIDDLTLEYSGNRLVRVSDQCVGPFYQGASHFVDGADEAEEYTYDSSGNTSADLNRGILETKYDHNNRPRSVMFADGSQTLYLYDATGRKRRTVHRVATVPVTVPGVSSVSREFLMSVSDYCGDIVYEDSLPERINLEGGYLSWVSYTGARLERPEYHFYLRDHLGNNCVDVTSDGGIWQAMDYYPYGLAMGSSYLPGQQRWLFGGKELDRISGLDLLDFEARAYDPSTGRFRQPDPLAENYYPLSQYLYCAANPLLMIDYSGRYIVVSPECGDEFKQQVSEAMQIIRSSGVSENLDYLDGLSIPIIIKKGTYRDDSNPEGTNTSFSLADNVIYWMPDYGAETDNDYFLSPVELLQHELDHGAGYNRNPQEATDRYNVKGGPYKNKEEERVVLGSETKMAVAMGRLPEGSVTRKTYGGAGFKKVDSLTATLSQSLFAVTIAASKPAPKPIVIPRLATPQNEVKTDFSTINIKPK